MYKVYFGLAICVLCAQSMFAQSDARGAALFDSTVTNNTVIMATGSGSHANAGGVEINTASFQGLANSKTVSTNSAALALGSGQRARLGGIQITEGAVVNAALTAVTIVNTSAAFSIGRNSDTSIGGILVESGARFSGSASTTTVATNSLAMSIRLGFLKIGRAHIGGLIIR